MADIRIKNNEADFKMRVNGLIIQNNHVLLVHINDFPYLSILGGHVDLGETSEEAIKWEMKEETQTNGNIVQLLGIVENDKWKQVKLAYEWIDIKELNNYDIRPSFIKDIIKNQTLFHHMIIDKTKK